MQEESRALAGTVAPEPGAPLFPDAAGNAAGGSLAGSKANLAKWSIRLLIVGLNLRFAAVGPMVFAALGAILLAAGLSRRR